MERSIVWDIDELCQEGLRASNGPLEEEVALAQEVDAVPMDFNAVIQETVRKAANGDVGAPFEADSLLALLLLQQSDYAAWIRVRGELKEANKSIPLVKLDEALKVLQKQREDVRPTHHGYAADVVKHLSVGPYKPVAARGSLFIPCQETHLWVELEPGSLRSTIAELHDGKQNCLRGEDYQAIAMHVMDLSTHSNFFEEADKGIACVNKFYSVHKGKIREEQLGLQHRQVDALPFKPVEMPTPAYDAFMHETFHSSVEGEEAQQRRLVEEFAGASMLGLGADYQKAILWTDPHGRAGKGTLQKIYEGLVPEGLRAAVGPFEWNKEYYLAKLAKVRLNVVGELPEDAFIPAAEFKTVIGGDVVTGRSPSGKPFTLTNEATHLFMSNYLVRTKDHSEAFYSRWILVEFPNSRGKSRLPLEPKLAERIVEAEMPGIAYRALQGAARLVAQGGYSASTVHDRLMAYWRRTASSVIEFIHEDCVLGTSHTVRRSSLYSEYVRWCKDCGRKPMSKASVRDLLERNIDLGIKLTTLNGYEIYRGLRLKADSSAVTGLDGDGELAPTSSEDPDF